MEELLKYWPIAGLAVQGAVLWFVWSMRQVATDAVKKADEASRDRDHALDNRIDAEAQRLTALNGRVDAVENEVGELPTKADLARVEGQVGVVDAKIDMANRGIERLEGYFLSKGAGVAG